MPDPPQSTSQAVVKILKMKDNAEEERVEKEHGFDLPFRVLLIGKSQLSGKTNYVGNLMLRPYSDDDVDGMEFYMRDFLGRNIYVVCPSLKLDRKWPEIISGKQIPDGNIMHKYDETELQAIYERIAERYLEDRLANRPAEHSLVILDDCAFSGALKEKLNGVLNEIACNGRHILLSMIVTAQKYSQVHTTIRENASGLILWSCSNKQLDLIIDDHCEIPKKDFVTIFRDATRKKYSNMVINYSNDYDKRLLDQHFKPLL